MACWNMDHLSVTFLFKPPIQFGDFPAMFDETRGYIYIYICKYMYHSHFHGFSSIYIIHDHQAAIHITAHAMAEDEILHVPVQKHVHVPMVTKVPRTVEVEQAGPVVGWRLGVRWTWKSWVYPMGKLGVNGFYCMVIMS